MAVRADQEDLIGNGLKPKTPGVPAALSFGQRCADPFQWLMEPATFAGNLFRFDVGNTSPVGTRSVGAMFIKGCT
ncbi:MAG: hypothetical protein OEZ10_01190 [Gammaproteobacteria bacterium]|nr:hypothetical protein [Gammaproteobacteria bacterium]